MATTRFFFDDLLTAAKALLIVVQDARTDAKATDTRYQFGGTTAQQILASGLWIDGDIDAVAAKVEKISGVIRHDD